MHRRIGIAGLALVLLGSVAACTSASENDASSDSSTAAGTSEAGGQATGIIASDDPRVAQIVDIVERAVPELGLQSVLFGVWVGDEEIVRGAVDAPSIMEPTAVDALVRVGQPMEAMLATIMLQLDEEGVLDMDAPVEQYLPQLVNADVITPEMLANSTSGTPDYVPNATFVDAVYANPFAAYTYDQLLGFAQQDAPLFEPGTRFAYSHTDMASLVEVLEAASGQPLDELMAERIFEPLDMQHSSAHDDAEIGQPAYRAFTHERGVYEESTTWNPAWGLNGGMNASVGDLGRWLRALNDGELLNEEDAALILSPPADDPGGQAAGKYFTFGSVVSGDWVFGNPSLNGYRGFTAQLRDPSVTIVVWSTAGFTSTDESNSSATIGERISAVVSDIPLELLSS
jgi:D-alanyl-D-alanine carboxypeptidase